jgi:3-dehydro-L-gulonate 2-dehydrogenase
MDTILISKTHMLETLVNLFCSFGFSSNKALVLSEVFTENSLCGVQSHGINRVPLFIDFIQSKLVDINAEATLVDTLGNIERWDGNNGPGIINAIHCTNQAISLAKTHGMGMVALRNTNHWMRGAYYAWHATQQNCLSIMFTNTKPNMPAWGGTELRIGNNPLVIAIPNENAPILLDMAMSQFSFGKMENYQMQNEDLPVNGGWDENGKLTKKPKEVLKTEQSLPMGYWKGSALSIVLDMLATVLSAGKSTYKLGLKSEETGVSQVFICISKDAFPDSEIHSQLLNEIIRYTLDSRLMKDSSSIYYPGEQSAARKRVNLKNGIPVNVNIWNKVLNL